MKKGKLLFLMGNPATNLMNFCRGKHENHKFCDLLTQVKNNPENIKQRSHRFVIYNHKLSFYAIFFNNYTYNE